MSRFNVVISCIMVWTVLTKKVNAGRVLGVSGLVWSGGCRLIFVLDSDCLGGTLLLTLLLFGLGLEYPDLED